jgi:hypothetical protein
MQLLTTWMALSDSISALVMSRVALFALVVLATFLSAYAGGWPSYYSVSILSPFFFIHIFVFFQLISQWHAHHCSF